MLRIGMILPGFLAGALLAGLGNVSAQAMPVPAPADLWSGGGGATVAADTDRLRKRCRSRIRRELGPARGRHTGSLRLAYIEQCIAAGGRYL